METPSNHIEALGFGFIKGLFDKDLSIEINTINGKIEIKGFGKTDLDKNDLFKWINYNEPTTIYGIASFANDKYKRFSASFTFFSRISFPNAEGFYSFVINPTWLILNEAVENINEIVVKKAYFSTDKLTAWTNAFHKKFDVFGNENPFLKLRSDDEKILLFQGEEYSLSLKLGLIEKILERNRKKIEVSFEPFFIVEFGEKWKLQAFLSLFAELCDLMSTFFNEKIYLTELYIKNHDDDFLESLEMLNNDILFSKYLDRETVPPKSEISYDYISKNSQAIFTEWQTLHPDIKKIISLYHLEFCKKERNIEESFTTFCSCIELLESTLSYLPFRAMDIKKSIGKKGRGEPSIFYYKLLSLLPTTELTNLIFKGLNEHDLKERTLNISFTRDYFHHRNKATDKPLIGKDLYKAYMQLKSITLYHLYTCLKIDEKEKSQTINRLIEFFR